MTECEVKDTTASFSGSTSSHLSSEIQKDTTKYGSFFSQLSELPSIHEAQGETERAESSVVSGKPKTKKPRITESPNKLN